MSRSTAGLRTLLDRIFADGIVEPAEREELTAYRSDLSTEDTVRVFREFVGSKWGEAVSDGVITSTERALLSRIVHELALQLMDLPHQARHALRDDFH
ncbi:MAG TPA: hypothetical protein VLC09_16020 [Polyangiaceae bacterium]|nr:hypothetical protein [Polyangiaceae bacterium]